MNPRISTLIHMLVLLAQEHGDIEVFGDDSRDVGEDGPTPEDLQITHDIGNNTLIFGSVAWEAEGLNRLMMTAKERAMPHVHEMSAWLTNLMERKTGVLDIEKTKAAEDSINEAMLKALIQSMARQAAEGEGLVTTVLGTVPRTWGDVVGDLKVVAGLFKRILALAEGADSIGAPPCPECKQPTEATAGTPEAQKVFPGESWRLCPSCGWNGSPTGDDLLPLALKRIIEVRDALSDGLETPLGADQSFDDWAADLAANALIAARGENW